jgi:hypothetical protein
LSVETTTLQPRRTQRSVNLKPRAAAFRASLIGCVRRHIAASISQLPGQTTLVSEAEIKRPPRGFDPEDVADIVPFNLPLTTSIGSKHSAARVLPAKPTVNQLLGKNMSGAKLSLFDRIKQKEQAKSVAEAERNPNAALIHQLELLVRNVLFPVWSRKPTGRQTVARVELGVLCGAILAKERSISTAECQALLALLATESVAMCAEVAGAVAGDTWCAIEDVKRRQPDGSDLTTRFVTIDHRFNTSMFKRFLQKRIQTLKGH